MFAERPRSGSRMSGLVDSMKKNEIYQIAIVGTGFSGICAAIQLQKNNFENFILFEKNEEIGGTWRDNTYPGAACDVHSDLYSFSFEPNPGWTRRFSGWQEILNYEKHCIRKYNLDSKIKLNTRIVTARFDNQKALWKLSSAKNEVFYASYVIMGAGPLHIPVYPDIQGRSLFQGISFHSSCWNHEIDYTAKTIAVIGTGASAIQIIPEMAKVAGKLLVFQRTPAWVIPKLDGSYSKFRRVIVKIFPFLQKLKRLLYFYRNELLGYPPMKNPGGRISRLLEALARKLAYKHVPNQDVAKLLIPNYRVGCKRILLSDVWYQTFARDNIELIPEGVKKITKTGLTTSGGVRYKPDVIIYCTGFNPAGILETTKLIGLEKIPYAEKVNYVPRAYKGVVSSGYPNFFFLVGPNTGLGHNSLIFMIERQVGYIIKMLKEMRREGADFFNIKPEAEDDYNERIQAELKNKVWSTGNCLSWYKTEDGLNMSLWPGNCRDFHKEMSRVNLEDYTLSTIDSAKNRKS